MDVSRRTINFVGALSVIVVSVTGPLLVVLPRFVAAQAAHAQEEVATSSNELLQDQLTDLTTRAPQVSELSAERDGLRKQIPAADELSDASALASAAARSSGARVMAITFADRQVFSEPTGLGLGEDGTPAAPQATVEPGTPHLQFPVTFEVEVSSTDQAAAFIDGLRAGPRMLQVVQAQSSPTNDAKRSTLTVEALIFAARG